jgi:hypothetical protein
LGHDPQLHFNVRATMYDLGVSAASARIVLSFHDNYLSIFYLRRAVLSMKPILYPMYRRIWIVVGSFQLDQAAFVHVAVDGWYYCGSLFLSINLEKAW